MMRPLYPERLNEEALAVNHKTKEEIMAAPDQKVVWNQFVDWVNRWNYRKGKWTAPIAGGKNIRAFDLKFAAVLNKLHCPKKEKTVLFQERRQLDLEDLIFYWFENETEPAKENMNCLRDYFGLSHEGGHDAMVDTRQTGDLIMRFLKLHRDLQRRQGSNGKLLKFAGAFAA